MKNYLLIISILIFSPGVVAQNLSGKFQRTDPATASRDIGISFNFGKNSVFEKTITKHLGEKEILSGTYRVDDDTLIIVYEEIKSSGEDPLVFSKKEKLSSSVGNNSTDPLFTEIRAWNSKGEPQQGVHLVLQDVEKAPVMAFSSNEKGHFPPLNIYDDYIKYLQVSYLGHQEVVIVTDSLFGFRTNLDIRLKDSAVKRVSKKRTEKYLIKDFNSEGLELVPLDFEQQELIQLTRES